MIVMRLYSIDSFRAVSQRNYNLVTRHIGIIIRACDSGNSCNRLIANALSRKLLDNDLIITDCIIIVKLCVKSVGNRGGKLYNYSELIVIAARIVIIGNKIAALIKSCVIINRIIAAC